MTQPPVFTTCLHCGWSFNYQAATCLNCDTDEYLIDQQFEEKHRER